MRKCVTSSATFVLALAALVAAGCEGEPRGRRVRLLAAPHEPAGQQAAPRLAPLRIAIAPVVSPRESAGLYRPLLEYISARLDRPVDLVQRRTYAEINDLIRYGRADAAFICDYAFVEGEQYFGMQILVVPIVGGKRTYHAYIIVPKESSAKDIVDLKGKSFAFSDPLSSTGWLFPAHLLAQINEQPESFFRRHVFTYSHDNTIKAVAQRLVDGGAVDSLVYEFVLTAQPSYREQTKVIQKSSAWGNPPVVVHPQIDPVLREKLEKIFLNIHQSREGRAVLAPLKIDRFVSPEASSYDLVRQMAEEARSRIAQTVRQRLRSTAKPAAGVASSRGAQAP